LCIFSVGRTLGQAAHMRPAHREFIELPVG